VCACAQASAARPARRTVVTRAAVQEPKQAAGAALAATALALTVGLTADVQPASADVAGLTPCSESKAYNKLLRKELKTLDKRIKKVGVHARIRNALLKMSSVLEGHTNQYPADECRPLSGHLDPSLVMHLSPPDGPLSLMPQLCLGLEGPWLGKACF